MLSKYVSYLFLIKSSLVLRYSLLCWNILLFHLWICFLTLRYHISSWDTLFCLEVPLPISRHFIYLSLIYLIFDCLSNVVSYLKISCLIWSYILKYIAFSCVIFGYVSSLKMTLFIFKRFILSRFLILSIWHYLPYRKMSLIFHHLTLS